MTTETLTPAATNDPTPTASATTTVGHLYRIIEAVLPFTDDDCPPIHGVHIEAGGGVIAATATNRYVLAHARGEATGDLPAVFLAPANARGLLDALHPLLNSNLDLYTGVNATSLVTLRTADGRLVVEAGPVRISPRTTDVSEWPDMSQVFAVNTAAEPTLNGPVWVDPRFLAALPKPGMAIHRFTFTGPAAPIRVEVEDWFVALVMPVKVRSTDRAWSPVPFGLPT